MLREQRPFKFFNLPATYMKEFVREAKGHGLLYVPIRNKQKGDYIELVVFADDAAKIQRIYDNLGREQPEQKPSVKKELQEIKQEQVKKKEEKAKQQDRQHPTPGHSRKKKKKQKGR